MKLISAILFFIAFGCTAQKNYPSIGNIERYDSSINALISPGAEAEIIAGGFDWTEGPLWIDKNKMLLFSDIPRNTIYKWTEAKGVEVYLTPSGYTDSTKRGGETGSNGLLLDKDGKLVLCQHGDRRMARMTTSTDNPAPKFVSIAAQYAGKKIQ